MKKKLMISSCIVLAVAMFLISLRSQQYADKSMPLENNDTQEFSRELKITTNVATEKNSDDKKPSRDSLVQEKLNRFVEQTAHINLDSIQRERKRIDDNLHIVNSTIPSEPHITVVDDVDGNTWQRLQYENGIVRYLPPRK